MHCIVCKNIYIKMSKNIIYVDDLNKFALFVAF